MKPHEGLYMESTGIAFKVANLMFGRIKRWFAREELKQDRFLRVDVAKIEKINRGNQLRIKLDITNLGYMPLSVYSITPKTVLINGEALVGYLCIVDCDLNPQQRKQVPVLFNLPESIRTSEKLHVNVEMLELKASKAGEKVTMQRMDLIHYEPSQAIAI